MPRSSFREMGMGMGIGRLEPMAMFATVPTNNPVLESNSKPVAQEVVISTVRQYFPETWLWSMELTKLTFSPFF